MRSRSRTDGRGADQRTIPRAATLTDYFATVAGAVDVPAMLQDAPEYLKVAVGPAVVAEVADRVPNIAAVKLEVGADGTAGWVAELGDRLLVFCGSGGLYLLDCLEQGATGVAPGADVTDLLTEIYALWASGDRDAAWECHRRLLPLLVFQMQDIDHYNATAKYMLCRRGILPADHLRAPCAPLDDTGRALMDQYIETLELQTVELPRG